MIPQQVQELLHRPSFQRLALGLSRIGSTHGIVGEQDVDQIRSRLIRPSLVIAPLLKEGRSVLDAGTGAGIPGLALSLLHPALPTTLVEPRSKCIGLLYWLIDRLPPTSTRVKQSQLETLDFSRFPTQQVVTRSALDWTNLRKIPRNWGPVIRWAGPEVPVPEPRHDWIARRLRWRDEQTATFIWWGPETMFHMKQSRGCLENFRLLQTHPTED